MKVRTGADRAQYLTWLRLLAYGYPGAGKTWLCASAAFDPRTAPVLYLEYRGQSASLAGRKFPPKSFVHLEIEQYEDFNPVLTWLTRGPGSNQAFDNLVEGGWFPKTVCIDSISEVQSTELLKLAGEDPRAMDARLRSDIRQPEIQHWGRALQMLTQFARVHYSLPFHLVITALCTTHVDPMDKVLRYAPALQGQASDRVPAYALTVMYMEQAGGQQGPYTYGYLRHVRALARDNTGAFPVKIANPTIPEMARTLEQYTEKEVSNG